MYTERVVCVSYCLSWLSTYLLSPVILCLCSLGQFDKELGHLLLLVVDVVVVVRAFLCHVTIFPHVFPCTGPPKPFLPVGFFFSGEIGRRRKGKRVCPGETWVRERNRINYLNGKHTEEKKWEREERIDASAILCQQVSSTPCSVSDAE